MMIQTEGNIVTTKPIVSAIKQTATSTKKKTLLNSGISIAFQTGNRFPSHYSIRAETEVVILFLVV